MTDAPATATPAEKEAEKSFWASFTQADKRLRLITFAGTVAANFVTVMVVAAAVILTRPPNTSGPTLGSVLIYLGCVICGVLAVGVGITVVRRKPPAGTIFRTFAVTLGFFLVAMGLITSVFLIVLLGEAAGLK